MQANLGMVAGEASGDMLAASVLEALQARRGAGTGENRLQMAGIGGPAMASRGFDCWWPSELLAVHGYAAALKVYHKLLAIRRRLAGRLQAWPARVFVGLYDALELYLGVTGTQSGVAHFAHLGGLLGGWLGYRYGGSMSDYWRK